MSVPNQPLFRSNAIKHYMQREEKHTLPRFISLPMTLLLWALLALFLVAGALVWSEQVPTYTTTQGIVVIPQSSGKSVPATKQPISPTAMAVFFISPEQVSSLHVGMPIRLHVGPLGLQVRSQIASIETHTMSPVALRSLFHLEYYPLFVTQPAVVVRAKLDPAFATVYAGSTLTADIQVGSQSLISLLPGVGNLF